MYTLQTVAEEKRAALDALVARALSEAEGEEAYYEAVQAALPEDFAWEDGEICWEETDGFRSLNCALAVQAPNAGERTRWTHFELTAVTEEVW